MGGPGSPPPQRSPHRHLSQGQLPQGPRLGEAHGRRHQMDFGQLRWSRFPAVGCVCAEEGCVRGQVAPPHPPLHPPQPPLRPQGLPRLQALLQVQRAAGAGGEGPNRLETTAEIIRI